MTLIPVKALQRLVEALQLPPLTTEVTINFSAHDVATMAVQQLLTQEQIDGLAEWYVTEGIDRFQYGHTTYTLALREQPEAVGEGDPDA